MSALTTFILCWYSLGPLGAFLFIRKNHKESWGDYTVTVNDLVGMICCLLLGATSVIAFMLCHHEDLLKRKLFIIKKKPK